MPLVIFHSRSDRKDNISYSKGGGGENKVTNDQDQEVLQVTTKQRRQRTEEEYSPTPPCVGGLGCSSGMNQYSLSCHFKKSFSLDGNCLDDTIYHSKMQPVGFYPSSSGCWRWTWVRRESGFGFGKTTRISGGVTAAPDIGFTPYPGVLPHDHQRHFDRVGIARDD